MVGSQLQSREAASSGTSRASALDDPPSTASPIGVPQERVDPRTLRIIEWLFPGHHGLDFLARLLRQAQEKQLALSDNGWPEVSSVAVISVQNLRILAKQLGLSYDTVEKYIVVFCRLRLLQKLRQRRQITLHFPLSCPDLPEPEALDHLLECRPGKDTPRYRPKVRSFAEGVRRRFVLLRERGEIAVAHKEKKGDSSGHLPSNIPQLLMEDIRQIIGQEVDFETGKRLLLKVEGVIRSRCRLGTSLLSDHNGDSERTNEKGIDHVYTKRSPSGKQKGDSRSGPSHQQSLLSAHNGDSLPKGSTQQSRLSLQKDDSFSSSPRQLRSQKLPSPLQKVDSFFQPTTQKGRLSAHNGDSLAPKGDSLANTSEKATPNVNVITLIDSITLNVSSVAQFCCQALGEKPEQQRNYSRLFSQIDFDAAAITAALLYTLVHQRDLRPDGTAWIRKPPAVFTQRCKDYHIDGIPEEAAALVQELGQLSYAQLLEQLQPKPSTRSTLPAQARQTSHLRPLSKMVVDTPLPPDDLHGMTKETYSRLVKLIRDGANTKQMRCASRQQRDGSYLALVEDYLGEKRWISSPQEWQACRVHLSVWLAETEQRPKQ